MHSLSLVNLKERAFVIDCQINYGRLVYNNFIPLNKSYFFKQLQEGISLSTTELKDNIIHLQW